MGSAVRTCDQVVPPNLPGAPRSARESPAPAPRIQGNKKGKKNKERKKLRAHEHPLPGSTNLASPSHQYKGKHKRIKQVAEDESLFFFTSFFPSQLGLTPPFPSYLIKAGLSPHPLLSDKEGAGQ